MEEIYFKQSLWSDEECTLTQRAYRKMLESVDDQLSKEDVNLIHSLYEHAAKSSDIHFLCAPGFTNFQHVFETVTILVDEVGLGRVVIVAALLTDLVRSKAISREMVTERFGEQVSVICDGMVKVDELYGRNISLGSENFRKLLFTFAQDVRVILIMLSSRLNTMRHLKAFSAEDQMRIGQEVSLLYAPMAHRMGLYGMKSELEDLSMKFTNRSVYLEIAAMLDETKRGREEYIHQFLAPLRMRLDESGMKYEMKGRTKTISSIYNKLKKKKMMSLEGIYDLFAIRIIIDCPPNKEKAECWRAYSIVTDLYQPNPVRLKDWISVPKGNGYESLHITVLGPGKRWVEVQIRTRRMDEVAEKGFCAHWKYKGIKSEENIEKWLANIREVLENPELSGVDFIDDFKLNLYDKEVFAFTPKGELRRLPKGATVLDFAFDIHTNVGRRCVGAIVNDRNVPLRYEIQNGDQVEILTSNHQEPKQDWINIVVTSKAKTKLRQALKEQTFRRSQIGREMLDRKFKNWKVEFSDTILNGLMKEFGYKDINIFLSDVGEEIITSDKIKEYVDKDRTEQDHFMISANGYQVVGDNTPEKEQKGSSVIMLDRGLTDIEFSLAKCCNPIFGDPVFAFVSATGGVKIHRVGCPNENDMRRKFGYRILEARWRGNEGNMMAVSLRVTGTDDIGIVTNITQLFQKEDQVKMRSITINSTEGGFEGDVTVMVASTDMLETMIKRIKTIKGVYSVTRIGK
ncbi:MAG: HD domain-containing protein [Bacteroidales bacterium]|nr:HD domain-containing protein [Bacteroidales bacterium]